jgi:hypothetical protein
MEETRSCSQCNETKSLSEYYYIKQENRYNKRCKLCINGYSKKHYSKNKSLPKVISEKKTCIKCNILHPVTQYYKQSKQKDVQQILVVSGNHDRAKNKFLSSLNLNVMSRWYSKKLF